MAPDHSSIQAVIVNIVGEDGIERPLKLELNSWVALNPGKRGGHTRDAASHGGNNIAGWYKAKILGFRLGRSAVSAIHVQHAYMHRQLDLDPSSPLSGTRCNYLYPSEFTDWIDPQSIMDVIVVMHAELGEFFHSHRSDTQLLHDSVFFYDSSYIPHSSSSVFGQLVPIPLPGFDSSEWPLPDMFTTEAFRAKLRLDFQNAMKPNVGSKRTHLSWFMPVGVFVDLFSVASKDMHKTCTMFVFKYVTEALMKSLMDKGWEEKVTYGRGMGVDSIKTMIPQASLRFKYHVKKSILYTNFVYNRYRCREGMTWEAIDQCEVENLVTLQCEMGDDWRQDIEVGSSWSLADIRLELQTYVDGDFTMWIIHGGATAATKVNIRNEKKQTTANVLPPKKLRLIPIVP